MKPFFVYILKCFDGFYYVGHTDDIEKRISLHSQGKISCFTQKRLPVELVFLQDFGTRGEAIEMERRIKGWTRKKKEALISQNWDELVRLSNYKRNSLTLRQAQGER